MRKAERRAIAKAKHDKFMEDERARNLKSIQDGKIKQKAEREAAAKKAKDDADRKKDERARRARQKEADRRLRQQSEANAKIAKTGPGVR